MITLTNYEKTIISELQKYLELDNQLQLLTGLKLKDIVEISKTYQLLVDNKNKTSVYNIAETMRKTGLSFQELNDLVKIFT